LTDLLQRMAATIERHGMLRPGQSLGVAVSGGADSVCLLHALVLLAPQWNLRLHVLHLNHNLRGEESREDAEFVRRVAAVLALPLTMGQADLASPADNLEQAARHARLAFFREAIAAGAVDRVALGHTRSDQAETVLFRFLRGSGTAGLAGIRPVTSDGLIRPLLEIERADVEQFLRDRSIAWREDPSNAGARFARNRIRHDLLPLLARDWNPSIGETLANTADWALAEEAYWEAEIDRLAPGLMREAAGTVVLRAEALRCLPVAAARRLVRHAMTLVKGDLRGIDFGHIAAVMQMVAAAEGHGRLQAPGLDIYRSFDWLRLARPGTDTLANRNYRFPATVPGSFEIPGPGGVVHLELVEKTEISGALDSVYNSGSGGIDWERVSGVLELRNWRPGDRYQPVGRSAEEKIKTLFQEARIPLWERRYWPVLTDDSSIVWARRFGPAERYAAVSGTRIALAIRDEEGRPGGPPH
jgi:tRNA(Ile)-lysidine synthase